MTSLTKVGIIVSAALLGTIVGCGLYPAGDIVYVAGVSGIVDGESLQVISPAYKTLDACQAAQKAAVQQGKDFQQKYPGKMTDYTAADCTSLVFKPVR
jgi:hypothetical protein